MVPWENNNSFQEKDEAEFVGLLLRYLDDQLEPEEWESLNAQLRQFPLRRRTFVRFCFQAKLIAEAIPADGLFLADEDDNATGHRFEADAEEPPADTPPVVVESSLGRPRFFASDHFIGGPVFSYIAATVILVLMLMGAWAYKITHFGQIVDNQSPSINLPEMQFVGQITGMVDCKWADPRTEAYHRAYVPLGRKYVLASGLMEITYDSGAKVILQGPCTYEVESPNGGFLTVGKLTARVVSGQWSVASAKPQAANPSGPWPLTPDPFFVRTPTAVVTDLGTEFGVEVNHAGDTMSHVFRGLVRMQVISDRGRQEEVVLGENESARVEKGERAADYRLVLNAAAGKPPRFARQLIESPKVLDPSDVIDGSIFHDDFDGDSVDAGKWMVATTGGGALSIAGGLATIYSIVSPNRNTAHLTGASALDFSDSSDDWWVEVRFLFSGNLSSFSGSQPRSWIVLAGSTIPPATWKALGFDLRAIPHDNKADDAAYDLYWWGWDNEDLTREPSALFTNLRKDRFYTVKIHRRPDGKVDIYLDDRLRVTKPLIGARNPVILRCGDHAIHGVGGMQIIDYLKVGVIRDDLVPATTQSKSSAVPSEHKNQKEDRPMEH